MDRPRAGDFNPEVLKQEVGRVLLVHRQELPGRILRRRAQFRADRALESREFMPFTPSSRRAWNDCLWQDNRHEFWS